MNRKYNIDFYNFIKYVSRRNDPYLLTAMMFVEIRLEMPIQIFS